MAERSDLWVQLLGDKPSADKKEFLLYNEKEKLLSVLPTGICRGDYGASLKRDELEDILNPLRGKVSAQNYVSLVSFLARGLEKGRIDLGWEVAIPAIPVTILRDISRFTPHNFQGLQRLRLIESAYLNSFKNIQDVTPEHRLGRLLLAAILYGGLLQNQWLEPWLKALNSKVRWNGKDVWLEMERVWQYPRDASDGSDKQKRSTQELIVMTRRWFADSFTCALIVTWLQFPEPDRLVTHKLPNPYNLIKKFLKHIGFPSKEIPENITGLLDMAETFHGLKVSPFLASYAAGGIRAVSLPAETWTRLCTRKVVPREVNKYDEDYPDQELLTACNNNFTPSQSRPTYLSEQHKMLKQMRKLFSQKSSVIKGNAAIRAELSAFVDSHNPIICPLIRYLAEWFNFLLTPKGKNKPVSVVRYFGAIASKLLVVCGNNDLLEFEAMEFTECYDQMVSLVSKKAEKGVARKTLGRFHDFLVRRHEAPQLDQAIFSRRSGPPETTVDANLIGQNDFDRVKIALGWNNEKRLPIATASLLIAILGFRCGMRRNEVRFLRIRDIHGSHRPEIVLRATSMRRLKSRNSTRRLPIHVLLTPDELALLMNWVEQYRDRSRDSLIFCMNGMPFEPLSDALVFVPIRQAMKLVTGDASLRYHHLRHSFANWLLIRLTGRAETLRGTAPFLAHYEFHIERINQLRTELLGNEHLGRKGAFVVASLCGHADLETTFTSYIHICDWLLKHELSSSSAIPHCDAELVMAVAGISRATVYRAINHKKNAKELATWDWEEIFYHSNKSIAQYIDPLIATVKRYKGETIEFKEEKIDVCFWERVQRALTMYQVEGAELKEISSKLDVSQDEAMSWFQNARFLAEMKTSRTVEIKKSETEIKNKPSKAVLTQKALRRKQKKAQNQKSAQLSRMARKATMSPFTFRHHDLKYSNPETGQIPFPAVPLAIRDRNQAVRFLDAFAKLDSISKREVFSQVEYFREFYSRTMNMLVFREPGKARKYIAAVKAIGVKNEMIRLLDFPDSGESILTRNERRNYWGKHLMPDKYEWRAVKSKTYVGKPGIGTIGVQITGRLIKNSTAGGYSKNCFLYAFYMIDIAQSSFMVNGVQDATSEHLEVDNV